MYTFDFSCRSAIVTRSVAAKALVPRAPFMHHIRWWGIHHKFNNLWRQLCEGRWCICGEVLLIFPQPPINLHSATSCGRQRDAGPYWPPLALHSPPSPQLHPWCGSCRVQFCNWQLWPAGHLTIIYQHCALMKSVLRNELYYCSCLWTNTKTKYYISFVYTLATCLLL